MPYITSYIVASNDVIGAYLVMSRQGLVSSVRVRVRVCVCVCVFYDCFNHLRNTTKDDRESDRFSRTEKIPCCLMKLKKITSFLFLIISKALD